MTDQRRAAVGGLLALGVGAFAVGKRKAEKKREEEADEFVEVPVRG
ncbi:hypothetical protein BGV91_gp06 [Haloarcula californiae icosahedral virus 1]|uniref:Uncharacterized protein n=1 Tax=Haloarcula californiae icosahedral virus 1 TaxID=1735722 RepID=A0A1C7A3P8_9VIRU|nr:hypothetical protein BGV91_gp06 [Haloarcula californiae icosahedral virus 1]ALJ99669.1 hypothetical protein SS136_06 [Haloarcula californiae icosahedral virus 1]